MLCRFKCGPQRACPSGQFPASGLFLALSVTRHTILELMGVTEAAFNVENCVLFHVVMGMEAQCCLWGDFEDILIKNRGAVPGPPYPQGFNPPTPPIFFLTTPAYFFSSFFLGGYPRPKFRFFAPVPRPFFVKSPPPNPRAPVPSVLPHILMSVPNIFLRLKWEYPVE